uniref:Uncharacterized protein n=1 Tax=Rhizophora mucronata TaxID=61149 RepID=A0A2P2QWG9_RHIMU
MFCVCWLVPLHQYIKIFHVYFSHSPCN